MTGIPAHDLAPAAAHALEDLLGHGVLLTTGEPTATHPNESMIPAGPTRTVALPFAGPLAGELTLIVATAFATSMEAGVDDGSFVSACLPALRAAADTAGIATQVEHAGEISTETVLLGLVGDFLTTQILENEEPVACLVVRAISDAAEPMPQPPSRPILPASTVGTVSAPQNQSLASPSVALHDFQPLSDGNTAASMARSLTLLNDVSMEVTAELGRMRMKVRDLMALVPGSVIELDHAAGSPVDVLMNGAIIAHGEVVVIDEEFGVRVAEIVVGDN